MSSRAKALANLYRRGKVNDDGLRQAVEDEIITSAEYEEITGQAYI